MKLRIPLIMLLGIALAVGAHGCGPDQPEADTAPAFGEMDADWVQMDGEARTVRIQVLAGGSEENNGWTLNGLYGGRGGVVVPVGAEIEVLFTNLDPRMTHSLGVVKRGDRWPVRFVEEDMAFPGGHSAGAFGVTEATLPGQADTFRFRAERPGSFALASLLAGRAAAGMWLPFIVAEEGPFGPR